MQAQICFHTNLFSRYAFTASHPRHICRTGYKYWHCNTILVSLYTCGLCMVGSCSSYSMPYLQVLVYWLRELTTDAATGHAVHGQFIGGLFAGLFCGNMHTVCIHQPCVVARADSPRGSTDLAGACCSTLQCSWAPPK